VLLILEDGRQLALPPGGVRIGRALDNDLVIADSRVSRYHAQVVPDGGGTLVRDLGSTNGTAVAGRVVAEDRLADGDTVSLGGYLITVRLGASGRPSGSTGRW
jgi:pSer/pThr/pTyr-binding forkhead associated (FHA) protein